MKKHIPFTILLIVLAACDAPQGKVLESAATDIPQARIPNPASVYCTQQSNQLEIRTAADGSQYGICVFPDGSTCDEWAFYQGECGSAEQNSPTPAIVVDATSTSSGGSGGYIPPGTTEEIADWWGVIKSTKSGAQYDDYFERQGFGQKLNFGINSLDPMVQAQLKDLRDSGRIVHLYGTLLSNVPDFNGSQIQVDRIEVEE